MSNISRSDLYMRSESGGEWFNEFLKLYSEAKSSTTNDILSAIKNKQHNSVESVVQSYRELVGLDLLKESGNEEVQLKTASVNKTSALSIRHASKNSTEVIKLIESNPKLKSAIESFCEHSGGNKSTHSIIHYLRDQMGNDVVSYTNDDLVNYIEQKKNRFKSNDPADAIDSTIGLVGKDNSNFDDDVAEYIQHGSNK